MRRRAASRRFPGQDERGHPLNGSSPAYIYLFAKVFVDRAVELGFDADVANRLF
ncbi:MAG: pyrroline-5-carboxylate reductase dimerization domain-containing protein [Anaerotruncus massiliensis (ex Togo et al. 2019)]